MKKKLVGILAIAGMIMLVGCGSVPTPKYNAPKSNVASSAITGNSLKIKYIITDDKDPNTYNYHEYFIFSGSSAQPLVTTHSYRRKFTTFDELFKVDPKNLFIYGTLGDKVVFTFSNGVSGGNPLAVYDFSDRKTYFLTDGNEKYMFLKKGTSYVVKLFKENKYMALNNLKEVKINESQYRALEMDFVTSGRRYFKTKPTSIMTTYVVGSFVGVREKVGKLPALLFGPQQKKVSQSFGFNLKW
jgi:hypothetical protein